MPDTFRPERTERSHGRFRAVVRTVAWTVRRKVLSDPVRDRFRYRLREALPEVVWDRGLRAELQQGLRENLTPTLRPLSPAGVILIAAGVLTLALVSADSYHGPVHPVIDYPDRTMDTLGTQFGAAPLNERLIDGV